MATGKANDPLVGHPSSFDGVSANTSRTENCAYVDICQYIPNRAISPESRDWAADNPLRGSAVDWRGPCGAGCRSGSCRDPDPLHNEPGDWARPGRGPALAQQGHLAVAVAAPQVDQPATRPLLQVELPAHGEGPAVRSGLDTCGTLLAQGRHIPLGM